MMLGPWEGRKGAGRISAGAGGHGRVSNPPLQGFAKAYVGTVSEVIFVPLPNAAFSRMIGELLMTCGARLLAV